MRTIKVINTKTGEVDYGVVVRIPYRTDAVHVLLGEGSDIRKYVMEKDSNRLQPHFFTENTDVEWRYRVDVTDFTKFQDEILYREYFYIFDTREGTLIGFSSTNILQEDNRLLLHLHPLYAEEETVEELLLDPLSGSITTVDGLPTMYWVGSLLVVVQQWIANLTSDHDLVDVG